MRVKELIELLERYNPNRSGAKTNHGAPSVTPAEAGIYLRRHWQAKENLDSSLRRKDEKKGQHRKAKF